MTIVLILCSTPLHSNSLRPIPAKVRFFPNSWFSLGSVSLSKLEEGHRNGFLNRWSDFPQNLQEAPFRNLGLPSTISITLIPCVSAQIQAPGSAELCQQGIS